MVEEIKSQDQKEVTIENRREELKAEIKKSSSSLTLFNSLRIIVLVLFISSLFYLFNQKYEDQDEYSSLPKLQDELRITSDSLEVAFSKKDSVNKEYYFQQVEYLKYKIDVITYQTSNKRNRFIFSLILTVFVFSIVISFLFVLINRRRLSMKEFQNELDLLDLPVDIDESRAEKLFKNHQFELQKYYNQTLLQGRLIFWTGIGCLIIGFGIIFYTLNNLFNLPSSSLDSERIITASFGAIVSIMSNFIGVIYLRMYSKTIKSLSEFHNRLVKTHHYHYANYLISKIKDEASRVGVIKGLAMRIAESGGYYDSDIESRKKTSTSEETDKANQATK